MVEQQTLSFTNGRPHIILLYARGTRACKQLLWGCYAAVANRKSNPRRPDRKSPPSYKIAHNMKQTTNSYAAIACRWMRPGGRTTLSCRTITNTGLASRAAVKFIWTNNSDILKCWNMLHCLDYAYLSPRKNINYKNDVFKKILTL